MRTVPRVSIVVPTRNRRALLEETLRSVRSQSYPEWEAIVVDDGSSDGTSEWMRLQESEDARIRYVPRKGEATGANPCRNQGFALSRGEFIVFLDSDDLITPTCLEKRLECMAREASLDFGVFLAEAFYETPGDYGVYHNVPTVEGELTRFLKRDIAWQTGGVLWRRAMLERIGPWEEWLPGWQDWAFSIRALLLKPRFRWFGVRDLYWRMPSAERDSINRHFGDPKMLGALERLFPYMEELLGRAGAMDQEVLRLVGGLYFELGEAWALHGDLRRARSLWKTAFRHGFYRLARLKLAVYAACQGRPWEGLVRKLVEDTIEVSFPVLKRVNTGFRIPVVFANPGEELPRMSRRT